GAGAQARGREVRQTIAAHAAHFPNRGSLRLQPAGADRGIRRPREVGASGDETRGRRRRGRPDQRRDEIHEPASTERSGRSHDDHSAVTRRGWREFVVAALGFFALTVVFTFPLAFHLGSIGRADNGDGMFSIWNVAWVARALVRDPLHVFDANIFYPHTL